jgi:hypothetical protein
VVSFVKPRSFLARSRRKGLVTVIDIPRGKYIGKPLGDPPASEAEHFIRCPPSMAGIDCRDLCQLFEHEGPLPHPTGD